MCAKGGPWPTPCGNTRTSFRPWSTQMVEVGEQTGALDNMLRKVGEFYDGEVEGTVNNLTAMLEPILTVVMGAMVGSHGRLHVPARCSTTSSTSRRAESEPSAHGRRHGAGQHRQPTGASRLRRRAWPMAVTVAFVGTGMAYSLFWAPGGPAPLVLAQVGRPVVDLPQRPLRGLGRPRVASTAPAPPSSPSPASC